MFFNRIQDFLEMVQYLKLLRPVAGIISESEGMGGKITQIYHSVNEIAMSKYMK